MSKIIIKKEKEQKILNFYPNVYKDEIKNIIGNVKTGDIVDVITNDMKFLAKGYVTEGTSAFVRILTTKDEKIDRKFIFERIKNAYEKRKHLLDETNSVRAFYSEADFIPGLIIDKFDKYVSIQFRNSGVEVFKQDIIEAVKKYLKPKGIYEYLLCKENDPFAGRLLSLRVFTDRDKLSAYSKQDGVCPICKQHFKFEEMEGDHIRPWRKGGHTTPDNCQMLCRDCNGKKTNRY